MVKRIPVVEEQVEVGTREVETGRVRVSKAVVERDETIDVALRRQDVDVERIRVDRPVDAPVATRQEGDVTIVSLHEEVTVVTKQLVVTEELHIRRRTSEVHEPQQITLRREEVAVEREPAGRVPPAMGHGASSLGPGPSSPM